MQKSVFLEFEYDVKRDAELLQEYSPISLLLADSTANPDDINEISKMILESPRNTLYRVTFEKLN